MVKERQNDCQKISHMDEMNGNMLGSSQTERKHGSSFFLQKFLPSNTCDNGLRRWRQASGICRTRIKGGEDDDVKDCHVSLITKQVTNDVPRGFMAIKVGLGEEQERFVVPVIYFNHPRFVKLLKEAEDEYGFDQIGPITIPCHVEKFRKVRAKIERDRKRPAISS